jgi:hypothetical protein
MTDEREHGLDFSAVQDELESLSYPVSTEELLDEYGDREIGTESGSQQLAEILGTGGGEEYQDPDDVHQSVLARVGESAEGRVGYSDRGGSEPDNDDQESL